MICKFFNFEGEPSGVERFQAYLMIQLDSLFNQKHLLKL